ncbi:DUF397 domain-containing protein [Streptomyces sp. NBC_00344]|uniref:DUF397 domain-containing protein n=1 Tax=Streptomyces sp. NBC_00344 TaxID=2975720 RepID=UPI002E1E88B3
MSTASDWFKSSHSGSHGECVEVTALWTKSTYSAEQGECIEVAATPAAIHVRDSKDIARPALAFSPAAWAAFTQTATGTDMPAFWPLT